MNIEKLLETLGPQGRLTRSNYHLTLGEAISRFEGEDRGLPVVFDQNGFPSHPHSYRGYYSDLALEPSDERITVAEFVDLLKKALDETFEGYKGGDFVMDEKTPLWAAYYGSTGRAITDVLKVDGTFILCTKEIDW